MSDDNSNDVVMVENTDNVSDSGEGTSAQKETRPLMKLFQRLISNDNKQNTVLTNAQIVSILLKEFNIDIVTLHELEVDIYLNVVKRFLKDWPKWDEFDQGINSLRKKNAHKSIKKTLESKYIDLKEYLTIQLEATKPLAQEAVTRMIRENAKRMEKVDTSGVILEIYCSRKQLNELVLNHPVSGDLENNIFHLTDLQPTSISLNKIPIESILNWWSVQVTIECKYLSLIRQTKHQFKHVLVNSRNGERNLKRELNTKVQYKEAKKQNITVDKQKLFSILNNLLNAQDNNQMTVILKCFIDLLKNDLDSVNDMNVPGLYRQHSNKYPYYRKLRKNVDQVVPVLSNYDLYIEETLSPMHVINIGKVCLGDWEPDAIDGQMWLKIECLECKLKFGCTDLYNTLSEHYDTYHTNEPDWICTNCEQTFKMIDLTKNNWHHDC